MVVDIGGYAITNSIDEEIITHSLGSCVAIIMYCNKTKYTAMAHMVLPEKKHTIVGGNSGLYTKKRGYFVDEIIPQMIEVFLNDLKCNKNDLDIYIVGGANSMNRSDFFRVGSRNLEKAKEVLKQAHLAFNDQHTSGNISRTVEIFVRNGCVRIRSQKMII